MFKKILSAIISLAININSLQAVDWTPATGSLKTQDTINRQKQSIRAYSNPITPDVTTKKQLNNPTSAVFDITKDPLYAANTISKVMVEVEKVSVVVEKLLEIYARDVQIFSCGVDSTVGNSYCPYNLQPCGNIQHYNDGYSQEHIGMQTTHQAATCPTGTNLPSQCTGSYPNTWLKDMYTTLLNRCPDQAGYNHWLNHISSNNITSSSQLQPTFCASASLNHEPCGSATPSPTTCYGSSIQNVTVQTPVTTTSDMTCPSGGTLNADKITCDKTCDNPTYYCPSGGTLSGSTCLKTCSSGYYYCPSGGTLSGSTCTISASGTPYQASCPSGYILTSDNHCMKYISAGNWAYATPTCPNGGIVQAPYTYNNLTSTFCVPSSTSYSASYTTSTYSCNYGARISSHNYYACPYNASCPSGTNLPSQCTGSYSNAWLKDMYTTLLNRCPDQTGYNHWLNHISSNNITSSSQLQPTFCTAAAGNNEPCGSTTPSATTCYGTSLQNVTVQQPVTTRTAATCPSGTNLPSDCSGSYPNTWLKQMYLTEFGRCPDQRGYDYWLNHISSNGITSADQLRPTFCLAASVDWQTACGTTANQSQCYSSNPYLYYTYHCNNANTNIYSESYIPQNPGGDGYTNSTPPTNNCVQQDYICNADTTHTCSRVNGAWQCSPNECDTDGRCGSASCTNGSPLDSSNYTTTPLVAVTSGLCNSIVCDAVEFERLGVCQGVPKCPTAFDVYEANGECYRDDCPADATKQTTFGNDFKCLKFGCPDGYVDNGSNCVAE